VPGKSTSLTDVHRILLGKAPFGFLLEVLLRTAVVYLLLVVLVRLLGKRMSGQVGSLEIAVMIVLGAIVGSAVQMPDRGALPTLALLLTALALQRGLSGAGARWTWFERLTQGGTKMLIKDGLLQTDELRSMGISHEQVFATLRTSEIRHLGQVKRLYIETSGAFSVLKREPPVSGLSVLPAWDRELMARAPHQRGARACSYCGRIETRNLGTSLQCPRCGHRDFREAIVELSDPALERTPSNTGNGASKLAPQARGA
jgi:uncharacterized membrane protein YcaP (DUF421 family)